MKSTPTPWQGQYSHGHVCIPIEDADSHIVARVETGGVFRDGAGYANARLIVTAVNSHAALVDALKLNLVEQHRACIALGHVPDTPGMTLARAALRLAGELDPDTEHGTQRR